MPRSPSRLGPVGLEDVDPSVYTGGPIYNTEDDDIYEVLFWDPSLTMWVSVVMEKSTPLREGVLEVDWVSVESLQPGVDLREGLRELGYPV